MALLKRCQEVVREAHIANRKKLDVDFFQCAGDSMFHAGSLNSPHGAIVGLPYNFNYNSTDEVDTRAITAFAGQAVNWDGPTGQKLLDTLVFSPAAQKFAIVRDIYMVDSFLPYMKVGTTITGCIIGYNLSEYTKKKYNMYKGPLSVSAV